MSDIQTIMKMIEENDVKYVDFRFTNPAGKWQHTAQHVSTIDKEMLEEGIMFDGSSIQGWKSINESDMTLMPDLSTAVMDPFTAQPQLILICNVHEPSTGLPYNRDPRSVANAALNYMKSTGIAETAYFGPEAEFFVFDDVKFSTEQNLMAYKIDGEEGPYNGWKSYEEGNYGHRPKAKGGYFPVAPVDSGTDIRAEMVTVMTEMGLNMEKHHHEVAPSQHELGLKYDELVKSGDNMQIYKFCTHMVAHSYGKTATFMPKPIVNDNGSGMHVHQSLWKGGKNLFAGSGYADLSETALYYIGGIIKHARAINAFSNATTNSYKRLVPGFEAPVLLAYSARNRSASCRIPFVASPNGKRVEVRFPDASGNPYLTYASMLMAGLDGIENKIHPGEPMDKDLYELPPEELEGVPTVASSLEEALDSLSNDRDFLLKNDVFTDDMIDGYISIKEEEVTRLNTTPHPVEFDMYYSV
ncbi:MAG: type I glutamate--ammonia ligase [Rhodospirillaceae bacterium]|nr:type I glutamate--ammonia ligase [Rhodospirillaceae bacterium]